MLTRNIPNTRKPNRWSLCASKTIGSLRLVTLTKYLSIACLSLAILSTLILNIVNSYSSSKIESNAIDSNNEPSTLANDSSSISLSFSNATGSCTDTSNSANVCMSIPDGGGIVTGGHTVTVNAPSNSDYRLTLSSANNETDSVNGANRITSISNPASISTLNDLADKTWGMSIAASGSVATSSIYGLQSIDNPLVLIDTQSGDGVVSAGPAIDIQYGAKVTDPSLMPAGDYSVSVVYTATALLPPTLSNLSVNPTTYEFDSCNDSLITIEGTNLSSAYEVYLQKSGTSDEANRLACTNLNLGSTNNQLTCNIPTSRDEVELNTTYDIYVISQVASPGVLKNAFTYTEPATGLSIKSTSENIIVDYDENLIPVIYVGYDGNGGGHWESLTKSEIADNTDNWFNYTNKQWANAVTVTKDSLSDYKDKHAVIDNNDVLGYWVYIPRYAYEVQRRDAVDKNVDPQNFDTVFQTADEKNIPIATSSTGTNHKDYRTSNSSHRTYSPGTASNPNSNTTWATHPAFSWDDTELNGIWVGKYETTGKISAPTVKPNQHANISEYIGNFYLAAKSIGKEDKCNVGGGSSSTSTTGRPTLEDDLIQNSHNLQTTKSHMLKNSEWGAITYLAHSKYGAGINTSYKRDTNVNKNGASLVSGSEDADGDQSTYSPTGCGPARAGSTSSYNTNAVLDVENIESDLACGSAQKAYNGSIGVLSSTTNNGDSDTGQGIYGVYGLSGGVGEYVMGNRTTSNIQSGGSTSYMKIPAQPPYVDLYVATPNGPFDTKPSWSSKSSEYYYNYDVCTFETCGGTATYETTTVQSVSRYDQSWGGAYSYFVCSSNPWFTRGSYSYYGYANPFYTDDLVGSGSTSYGSRAALLALPVGQ